MRSFEGGALYQISGTRVSGRFYGSSEKGRSSTVAPRPLYRPIFARTRGGMDATLSQVPRNVLSD